MIKNFLKIIVVSVLCLVISNIKAQNNYKVTFYIHEMDYDTIYIQSYCGSNTEIVDSIKISKDGGFHWQAKDMPMGMYMAKSQKGDLFSFTLDKSKEFSVEIYPNGEFFVKGSPENDAYFLYQKENKQCQTAMYYYKLRAQASPDSADILKKEINAVIDSFTTFQRQFFAAYPENLISVVSEGMNQSAPSYFFENGKLKEGMQQEYQTYYRKHYWDKFHFNDIRVLYTPYFINQYNTYITEIANQQTDSVCVAIDEFIQKADSKGGREYADYVIAWYLDKFAAMPFSFNQIVYTYIVNKYLDRASGYLMPSVIEFHKQNVEKIKPFLPGNTLPNIRLLDFNGVAHSLYSLKNNYTVLYFFSSLCESCKKDLDDLKDFYKHFKQEYDVEIYSIDIEPDYAICKARQEADPYPWIVTHATAEELSKYNFNLDHTPQLFILDKNKKIINQTAIYKHVQRSIENDIYQKQNK